MEALRNLKTIDTLEGCFPLSEVFLLPEPEAINKHLSEQY